MAARVNSYREVQVTVDNNYKWKDLTIQTGADNRAVETTFVENGGGYCYLESNRIDTATANRFIYWRTYKNVLELVETSLDFNLSQNCLRLVFKNAAVLGGVSIQEAGAHVYILVPTVCSVHRLIFPHPNRLQQYDQAFIQGLEHTAPSIFSDVTVGILQNSTNFYTYNAQCHSVNQIIASSSWIGSDKVAYFSIASNLGTLLLIKLPEAVSPIGATQHEMKCSSVMQRLWSGLVPGILRGSASDHLESSVSVVIHPLGGDTLAFSVCKDHKLRIWSLTSHDCIAIHDLIEYTMGAEPSSTNVPGDGHLIRKSVDSRESLLLGVFLSFRDHKLPSLSNRKKLTRTYFIILRPLATSASSCKLEHITNLFTSQDALVDFQLSTSQLWSLWRSTNDEQHILCANINSVGSERQWLSVVMEPTPDSELQVHSHIDPRQQYLDQIFYSRFSTATIIKALNIYKRSLDSTELSDSSIPVQALIREVSCVVELEIQKSASEYEMIEEEYVELQNNHWDKFYSCCVQYHQRAIKCSGLVLDANTGLVANIKQGEMSVLRPSQITEHLSLGEPDDCRIDDIISMPLFAEDEGLCQDVLTVSDCLHTVSSCLSEQITYSFEQDMFHAQNPAEVAATIATVLLQQHGQIERMQTLLVELEQQVKSVGDLVQAIECLLLMLDLSDLHDTEQTTMEGYVPGPVARLLDSDSAVATLVRALTQTIDTRFNMARNLLIFLSLCAQTGPQSGLDRAVNARIREDFLHKSAILVQTYYIIKWACSVNAVHPQTVAIENNAKQMEVLNLIETSTFNPMHKFAGQCVTLLELFIRSEASTRWRHMATKYMNTEDEGTSLWSEALLPYLNYIAHFLWPLNGSPVFLQFLMTHSQFVHIQEWVRLTSDWCEWNISTATFMLAYSYLNSNEPDKAMECFLEAAHGVSTEEFLGRLIQAEEHEPEEHAVRYYFTVISLYEVLSLPSHVVSLAKITTSLATDADQQIQATLWSKIFKQELEMGHNEDAFKAMLSNPDSSRRKDCLRQFVVVLCERGELQMLVEQQYNDTHINLEEETVHILNSRARSIDLTKHNYYDLLYSFHVFRANFRKAGSAMYEHGMRLGQEASGIKALQKQAKCYLAALNALRLVDPKYAWIIKPAPALPEDEEDEEFDSTEKQVTDSDEPVIPTKKNIEIVELADIEKEYQLVHARLQLIQKQQDIAHVTGPTHNSAETVGLLVNAGLFDCALTICNMCKLSLAPIFEGLASRCIDLSEHNSSGVQGDNDVTSRAWSWLQHNQLPASHSSSETSATTQAWALLMYYLENHEESTGSRYHRVVANKLFCNGFPLPSSFVAKYKKLNAAELLRLYLDYDLLEEASDLAKEYIEAVMGKGQEYFGLKTFLHAGCSSVWLPYTALDQLLSALNQSTDPTLGQLYIELQDLIMRLFDVVEKVSQDNLEMSYRNFSTSFHEHARNASMMHTA